jgi:hypothetical protein
MTRLIIFLLIFISNNILAETTGNLLTNSNFSDGLNGWTNHGTTQQHHTNYGNECSGSAVDNINSGCGTTGSLATLNNGGVNQTISLSETTNMTVLDIQNGFSSEMSADVWFWNGTDTVTMTQTATSSDGTINTQNRIVTNNHNNYQSYLDTLIIGNNTATDFDINARIDIDTINACNGHCGPDLDNIQLRVSYDVIPPWSDDVQDEINNIEIDDSFLDNIILDEIILDFEEITFEDALIELDILDFEEIVILDAIAEFDNIELDAFEEIDFEEFEEIDFEEMSLEDFEDIDFEELEEAIAEEPMIEEVIEDVAMEEEEIEIAEEEEIETVEEPTEEIINAEETETQTTEILEEEIEDVEDVAEIEEIETVEEPTEEIINAEETETQTTEILEEEIEDVEDVAEIEEIKTEEIEVVNRDIKIDVNDNIEVKVEEITLFSNNNALQVYNNTDFYKPQQIYSDMDNSLFIQADLGIYTKDIYTGITLGSYINTDPIGQQKQKMYNLKIEKIKIMIDLKKLKGLL